MIDSLRDKTILITGGTRGIGLATGLAFGAQGATAVLTHRWGTADEDEIVAAFKAAGAPAPIIKEADVSNADDLTDLMETLKTQADRPYAFISNAAFAPSIASLDDYRKRDFLRAFEYTTWPMASYTSAINDAFGAYPRYVVGLSSPGHVRFVPGYDAVAMAKSMLETMCSYMAQRLGPEGANVNIVRAGFVDTDALASVIGAERVEKLRKDQPNQLVPAEEVASAVVAICSGLLDGMNGTVLPIDRGTVFGDTGVLDI